MINMKNDRIYTQFKNLYNKAEIYNMTVWGYFYVHCE